ncbi:MAG: 50S ribosomal protein L13 [Coriobacteriia bacterium]|nr:50S ribosomal protein L13 [Coriobacteriia bacterium]MCL2536849.1 50S ribosomal protein L13 [Coriobacteriia bacterium]
MKTYYAKPGEVQRDWVLVDATDMVLGRLATRVAEILKGKTKPQYTPHVDVGDFVVVINAEKIRLTGNKAADKNYYSHSGYPGGLKEVSFERMLEKHPERIIEKAVRGMLPKNTLGRQMGKKLKVYAGPEHPHEAQNPQLIELKG